MSFLSCPFDKTKRHLIDIFSLYRNDDLKQIIFSHLLVFCAVCLYETG